VWPRKTNEGDGGSLDIARVYAAADAAAAVDDDIDDDGNDGFERSNE
jgi:hypothetical protein